MGGGWETFKDVMDPFEIFHGKTQDEKAADRINHGLVFGEGGSGHKDRREFRDRQRDLWGRAEQGQDYVEQGLGLASDAAQAGQNAINRGKGIIDPAVQGVGRSQSAAKGYAGDLAAAGTGYATDLADTSQWRANLLAETGLDAASGLRGVGDSNANAIMAEARRQGPSQAAAQFDRGQLQARTDAMALAATMGRGGNQALAARQAQQALAGQGAANNANSAIMRAGEEAALRNSRIAAATGAGQQRLGAYGQAGQLGNAALQGAGSLSNAGQQGAGVLSNAALGNAANIESGLGAQGINLANVGANLQLGGIGAQNTAAGTTASAGNALSANNLGFYQDAATAQLNTDLGFGTNAQAREAEKSATGANMLGGVLGMFGG